MNISKFYFLSCLLLALKCQNLNVGLNNPLLLNQQHSGIITISYDYQGNYYVSFSNEQTRKYTVDMTSYQYANFSVLAQKFNFRTLTNVMITLSNSTTITLPNIRTIVVTTNSLTTVIDYDYYSYERIETIDNMELIRAQMGFPLLVLNTTYNFHILIGNNTIKVYYKGILTNLTSFTSYFNGSYCLAATYHTFTKTTQTDQISFAVKFILSLSNSSVFSAWVTLNFLFNYTSNDFDLHSNIFTPTQMYTFSSPITLVLISRFILLMQSNSTGNTAIYDLNMGMAGTTVGIPQNQIFKLLSYSNIFYILESKGLIKLIYNPSTVTLSSDIVVSILPQNVYSINLGLGSEYPFYIPGQPYIYKSGSCLGQTSFNGASCVGYSCVDNNCQDCSYSSNICSVCIDKYKLSSNGSICIQDIPVQEVKHEQFFANLFEMLINAVKIIISIPGARHIVSPIFYYFGIFDDIYLYQFHDRLYGQTMTYTFKMINSIEISKWSLINSTRLLSKINLDNKFQDTTQYTQSYNYFSYTESQHASVGSQGFWQNCQNFIVITVPITLISFILIRLLYKFSFPNPFFRFLRPTLLWPFFFIVLLDGNIQQISFYFSKNFINLFNFNFSSKIVGIITVYVGFILIFSSIGLFIIGRIVYGRLQKYILGNNNLTFKGRMTATIQFGLRNMILGMVHSYGRYLDYQRCLLLIFCIQFIFMGYFIKIITQQQCRNKLKLWIYILINIIKLLIIITLYFDWKHQNISILQTLQHQLLVIIGFIYFYGIFVQTSLTIKQIIQGLVKIWSYYCSDKSDKKKRKKQLDFTMHYESRYGNKIAIKFFKQGQLRKYRTIGGQKSNQKLDYLNKKYQNNKLNKLKFKLSKS